MTKIKKSITVLLITILLGCLYFYIDNIKYTNEDRVIIDRNNSTNLGKATIDFFGLNNYPAYARRAQQFGNMEKYPIDSIKLAKVCSAYKRTKKV